MLRECSGCQIDKPLGDFYRQSSGRAGHTARCKACLIAEKKVATYPSNSREARLVYHRRSKLRTRYGLSIDDYEKMLADQGGVCAICGGVSRGGRSLDVDHDHSCCPGERTCGSCIRGLLCLDCNTTLGKVQDDVDRLRKMISYLVGDLAA